MGKGEREAVSQTTNPYRGAGVARSIGLKFRLLAR
ncbi:MAG: hypothetical protein M2R45_01009 [Verrucomicrobia subdivision 3 bacterium]|nr:hypothetical protein [Limisphaerales bacterium]MCS1414120.1 hypothetical protein [Limisphaerales bacterium]